MKTNLFVLVLTAVLATAATLVAKPGPDVSFAFAGEVAGIEDRILYTPAESALALEKSEPRVVCPDVPVSLAAELCEVRDESPAKKRRRMRVKNGLAVELADGSADRKPAESKGYLAAAAPLLLLARRRRKLS